MENKIVEEGIVVDVVNGIARVKAVRGTSCDGCGARAMCKPTDGTSVLIEARNELGACVGERVEVAMKPGTFLKASFIAYIIPLISFFTGGVIGKMIGGIDIWAALSGIIFMILCYSGIWVYNKRALRDGKYQPVITAVLSS